jgi:hypothetical protein
MKFLCVDCDAQMSSVDASSPGDGTLAMVFHCPSCDRRIAMLTNPMETQMVNSLCVDVGERTGEPQQPFRSIQKHLETGPEPGADDVATPAWSAATEQRLARIPGFVRGMVRRLYAGWAAARGIEEITTEHMDEAKAELGLEEM